MISKVRCHMPHAINSSYTHVNRPSHLFAQGASIQMWEQVEPFRGRRCFCAFVATSQKNAQTVSVKDMVIGPTILSMAFGLSEAAICFCTWVPSFLCLWPAWRISDCIAVSHVVTTWIKADDPVSARYTVSLYHCQCLGQTYFIKSSSYFYIIPYFYNLLHHSTFFSLRASACTRRAKIN